jgi:ribosomal protein S18 acetylase RimI-like enzyme
MAHATQSPGVVIRKPTVDEARTIATLHVRSWQATYRGMLSERYLSALDTSIERRVAFLAKAIEEDSLAIRVAEREGRVLGWCSFGPSRDEDADASDGELMAIYLAPEAVGQGIGPMLWSAVRQVLVDDGFARVTAWVLDGNERASRFYRAQGFTVETASQRVFEENGEPLPLTRFNLLLTAVP